MIRPRNLPTDFKVLTEHEFTQAYIAAREECGDTWSTFDVMKSWTSYQKDPAGHFLSKPPYITLISEQGTSHEQQLDNQKAGITDR